jgi:hemolysin activation/secretion protein
MNTGNRASCLIKYLVLISISPVFLLSFVKIANAQEIPEQIEIAQNQGEQGITVKEIEVIGSTIFTEADFQEILAPLIGQTVSREELAVVVEEINQLYLKKDYLTSSAVLVEESLETDKIVIAVVEGSIEEIIIEDNRRVRDSYIRKRIARGTKTPFNPNNLEDQLRLLRVNPLFENVSATLRRGNNANQNIVVVKVEEANPFSGKFEINNYSPVSIGQEKFELDLSYANITGNGDRLSLNYGHTFVGGMDDVNLGYNFPVNSLDGNVGLRFRYNANRVVQKPFDQFNISGESTSFGINYRQPIIKNPRQELALSIGFTHENGRTFLFDQPTGFGFGPDADGRSKTSVINFAQDYLTRNDSGVWYFRSQLNFGTGLFDATSNESPIPDGQFFSWLGQVQRVQIFSPNHFLIIQTDVQLTPDSLLPAQQFTIGGGQSVRGYRQNYLAADNGVRLSVEDRIIVKRDENGAAEIQLAPFLDFGAVINNKNNPNSISQNQTVIAGLGLGLLWNPEPNINVRFDYAAPLVKIDNKGDTVQDRGFYFSVGYNWQ